jgi:hypothetical protein
MKIEGTSTWAFSIVFYADRGIFDDFYGIHRGFIDFMMRLDKYELNCCIE